MRRKIVGVLLVGLMLCGCGKNEQITNTEANSTTDNQEIVTETTDTEETTEEQFDSEEFIRNFYLTISDVYDNTRNNQDSSVNSLIEESKETITEFMTFEDQVDYSDYILKIQSNPRMIAFYDMFIANEYEMDFDNALTQTSYRKLAHELLQDVLIQEIPFEIDVQKDYLEEVVETPEGEKYDVIKAKVAEYAMELQNSGLAIEEQPTFYTTPEDKWSEYSVDNDIVVQFYPSLEYDDANTFYFGFEMWIYGYPQDVYSTVYSAGDESVTYYSSDMINFNLYGAAAYSYQKIYSAEFGDDTNARYDTMRTMFMSNDAIEVSVDNRVHYTLTKDDIEKVRAWMLLFDVLHMYDSWIN